MNVAPSLMQACEMLLLVQPFRRGSAMPPALAQPLRAMVPRRTPDTPIDGLRAGERPSVESGGRASLPRDWWCISVRGDVHRISKRLRCNGRDTGRAAAEAAVFAGPQQKNAGSVGWQGDCARVRGRAGSGVRCSRSPASVPAKHS